MVYVAVNGQHVYEDGVSDDSGRGIHVVVLNQNTGVVMATRIFDTYMGSEDEQLILFCNMLQEGRIVVFMVKVRYIQFAWKCITLYVFESLVFLTFASANVIHTMAG